MRLFELLLILIAFTDAATRIRFASARPIWTSVLPLTAFFLAILHLAAEGGRWQMLPVYATVAVTFVLALVRAFQSANGDHGRPLVSRVAGVSILLAAIGSLVAGTAFPVYELPAPTGYYTVGIRDLSLETGHRVRVHYPSDEPSGERAPLSAERIDRYRRDLAARYDLPPAALSHLAAIRTYADPVTRLSRELPRFRVLIAAPDPGRSAVHATSLLEDLASHGFIVVSAPKPTEPNALEDPAAGAEVVEQIAAGLERLHPEGETAWLSDRLDLARIGVFGIGPAGRIALDACANSTFRAGAAIGLDLDVSPPQPVVPFLYLLPEGDTEPPPPGAETAYTVSVRGARHDNFSDDAFVSPLMPTLGDFGSIDPYRGNAIVREYVRAFFNKHLTRGTVEPVLDGPSDTYPEVAIHIHDTEE